MDFTGKFSIGQRVYLDDVRSPRHGDPGTVVEIRPNDEGTNQYGIDWKGDAFDAFEAKWGERIIAWHLESELSDWSISEAPEITTTLDTEPADGADDDDRELVRVEVDTVPVGTAPGAFRVHKRLPADVWKKMKAAHAWYLDREQLDDFDRFGETPGWRYSLDAIKVLLASGYALNIRGERVTKTARLDDMFSARGIAEYRQRIAKEQAERNRKITAEKEAKKVAASNAAAAFDAWTSEHLDGLVKTYALDGRDNTGIEWQHVASFGSDTPGTWSTTGNEYYSAVVDGCAVYKCYYGNAVVAYAPQHIVDEWCNLYEVWLIDVYDGGIVQAARKILIDSLQDYIGSDMAARLVQMRGAEHYVQIATSEMWYEFEKDHTGWTQQAADAYGFRLHQLTEKIPMSINLHSRDTRHETTRGGVITSYWYDRDADVIIARGWRIEHYEAVSLPDLPQPVRDSIEEYING